MTASIDLPSTPGQACWTPCDEGVSMPRPARRGVIAGVVLAAGAGRRFGAPKQLADLGGRPMLERVLAAIAAAPLDRAFVVLGAEAEAILERVDLRGTEAVIRVDWETGLSAPR